MRVTIRTLLNLPSLSHAKVVAGEKGLDKVVDSISVLEYSEPTPLQEAFFDEIEFYGNEIAVAGFAHIKDDVDAQCQTIMRLHKIGEVGLILYYVGIFVPKIDKRLIDLANELDFTLICMPENRMDLKYSEVIYEVIETIIKNKAQDPYFVPEMLERISKLPDHQRSIDTVLRIISDRMTSSFYLVDSHFNAVNMANWPAVSSVSLEQIAKYYQMKCSKLPAIPTMIELTRSICVCGKIIESEDAMPMHLIMVKEDGTLSDEQCEQAAEVIQLFINIWSKGHGKIGTDELVKAILNDEPMKMKRLAEILSIDIQAIEHMIILRARGDSKDEKQLKALHDFWQHTVSELVALYFDVSFTGIYHDTFVVFLGSEKIKCACQAVEEALLEMCTDDTSASSSFMLATAYGLANTAEVRRAFLLYKDYFETAKTLYPHRKVLSQEMFAFAKRCHDIITIGENSILEATSILAPLMRKDGPRDLLCETLTIYLLDGASNVAATAALLFVHKNTIKYRMNQICAALNYDVNAMPEHYSLYRACAVKRLLDKRHSEG